MSDLKAYIAKRKKTDNEFAAGGLRTGANRLVDELYSGTSGSHPKTSEKEISRYR